MKAGITQTPTSALKGSPRPPFASDVDAFSRNGTNGWWEADCAPDCGGTGGSNAYQGSVVEGLWEFPQDMGRPPVPPGVGPMPTMGLLSPPCIPSWRTRLWDG